MILGGSGIITSDKITTDANGNFGIGTSSPVNASNQKSLTINGTSYGRVDLQVGGSTKAFWYAGSSGMSIGPQGALYLGLETNNTERMRIDSNGYVTKSNQPAFKAYSSPNYSWGVGTVSNNTTTYNTGNHFNTSTYKFTAPVAGYYYFFANMRFYNSSSGYYVRHLQWAFRINNSSYETFDYTCYNNINSNQHWMMIGSTIMYMAASDTASVYIDYIDYNGAINTYGSQFVGYLLG